MTPGYALIPVSDRVRWASILRCPRLRARRYGAPICVGGAVERVMRVTRQRGEIPGRLFGVWTAVYPSRLGQLAPLRRVPQPRLRLIASAAPEMGPLQPDEVASTLNR